MISAWSAVAKATRSSEKFGEKTKSLIGASPTTLQPDCALNCQSCNASASAFSSCGEILSPLREMNNPPFGWLQIIVLSCAYAGEMAMGCAVPACTNSQLSP